MKACAGETCTALVPRTRRLCHECISANFQRRSVTTARQVERVKANKSALPTESDPDFVEDAPRFEKEYEARWTEPSDPHRNTGRTTGIALQLLGEAVAAKITVTGNDHDLGRSGQTALITRVQSIADAIGWPVEVEPDRGGYGVRVTARYIPNGSSAISKAFEFHVEKAAKTKAALAKEYKTVRRRGKNRKRS